MFSCFSLKKIFSFATTKYFYSKEEINMIEWFSEIITGAVAKRIVSPFGLVVTFSDDTLSLFHILMDVGVCPPAM
jgi:hypothetical protein